MHDRQPTLLIFTLGAASERARQPLLPAPHGDAELALRQACLDTALEAGREAGCRLQVSAPAALPLPADVRFAPQTGDGFGGRLEQACEAAARHSSGPLLVVGSDVPGLSAAPLQQALAVLADDPRAVVLGPSPDGGFYLLAAARPIPHLADRAPWCRHDTLATLRRSLVADGFRVVLLAPLLDLDRRHDLERWLGRAGKGRPVAAPLVALWRSLMRHLAALVAALRRPPAPRSLAHARWRPLPVRAPRGPPHLLR